MPLSARLAARSTRAGRPSRHAALSQPLAGLGTAAKIVGVPALMAAVVSTATPAAAGTITVRWGDTLSEIAQRHGTSVSALVRANGLPAHGNFVPAGVALRVPSGRSTGSVRRTVGHTVRAGDTLWEIARRYRTSVAALMRSNGLRSALIVPGQRLRIGSGAASSGGYGGAARGVPSRYHMRDIIADTARRYGVDPALALAISWQEAGWQQDKVSVAHAIGAMQVIPDTADWISGVTGRRLDPHDAHDNALIGVVALRVMLDRMSKADAIAGYYQGMRSVQERGWYAETHRYVANVLALEERFS
jgi:N-acetylmuramoyl-L-alanine amidase